MGRNKIDLTGQRFGKLVAISIERKNDSSTRTYWNCVCDCGGKRVVSNDHLRSGDVTDCGCTRKHVSRWSKHNMYNSRLYGIWSLMKERCCNPKRKEYPNYGGRGICVCEEWKEAKNFIEWSLNNGYSDELTIDRIDNNGNYCPENCRWISRKEQMQNRRNNHYISFEGKSLTLTQLAKENGLTYSQLYKRLKLGWTLEKAISEPIHYQYTKKGDKS